MKSRKAMFEPCCERQTTSKNARSNLHCPLEQPHGLQLLAHICERIPAIETHATCQSLPVIPLLKRRPLRAVWAVEGGSEQRQAGDAELRGEPVPRQHMERVHGHQHRGLRLQSRVQECEEVKVLSDTAGLLSQKQPRSSCVRPT